ncbi:MAG: hypothetical protein ABIH56_00370 [Candidatus Margulisiibacteriota bacterium]
MKKTSFDRPTRVAFPPFNGRRIIKYGNPNHLTAAARSTWGDQLYSKNMGFFARAWQASQLLQDKAHQAGQRSSFSLGKFYAAATLAVKAHVNQDGGPILRKSGELYVYHMLRIIERLTETDAPYLGGDAYVAVWLHDTLEDTSLSAEELGMVFGERTKGIVQALSNLKTGKQETKLQQAERYEPLFIRAAMRFMESIYIKMADLDDYFDTCKKLSPESKFYHFRFVDEVIFPLAVAVVGARAMALNVANKALKIAHPTDFSDLQNILETAIPGPILQKYRLSIVDRLLAKGLNVEAQVAIRTPYEMFVKYRAEAAEAKWNFSVLKKRLEHYELPPIAGPFRYYFSGRNLFFIDVMTEDEAACYQVRALLAKGGATGGSILPERSRDFIVNQKPNGYRALHDEFKGEIELRLRIFSRKMNLTNRLGLAAVSLSASGMASLSSPLLSESSLELTQRADREGRRHLLQRLPHMREVEVGVKSVRGPLRQNRSRHALIDQRSTWFDLAAACDPGYPLRLVSGEWEGRVFGGGKLGEVFQWFSGQNVSLTLATSGVGHDLFSLIREPNLLSQVKTHISRLPFRQQVNLGKKMIVQATVEARRNGIKIFSYSDLHGELLDDLDRSGWFQKGVTILEDIHNTSWASADDFYRQIASGAIPLHQAMGAFYSGYNDLPF